MRKYGREKFRRHLQQRVEKKTIKILDGSGKRSSDC